MEAWLHCLDKGVVCFSEVLVLRMFLEENFLARSILMEQTFRITAEERSLSWPVPGRARVANLATLHQRFGWSYENIERTLQAVV